MVQRRHVALIYRYNENWIGGTYYIENLINALTRLPDADQPRLDVITDTEDDFARLRARTAYPRLFRQAPPVEHPLALRAVNKAARAITGRNLYPGFQRRLSLIFPADDDLQRIPGVPGVHWIPDFQEHFLPDFFSEQEITWRKASQSRIVNGGRYVVFSSHTAKKHFNLIYPGASLRQFVLRFAVSNPPGDCDITTLRGRYGIPADYFICSNQFWQHKNHRLVFEALALLKRRGTPAFVVFTGKESDYRNPDFIEQLKRMIVDLDIADCCVSLGFIDRVEQLSLMKHATSVLQPSLFEGWSTVIEDAKSLAAPVLASDIDVHREQLESYHAGSLFDPADADDLARAMTEPPRRGPQSVAYDTAVEAFARDFRDMVEQVAGSR